VKSLCHSNGNGNERLPKTIFHLLFTIFHFDQKIAKWNIEFIVDFRLSIKNGKKDVYVPFFIFCFFSCIKIFTGINFQNQD